MYFVKTKTKSKKVCHFAEGKRIDFIDDAYSEKCKVAMLKLFVDQQRKLLADVDVTPPRSRSLDISMFCIEKCKRLEMLVSSKATALGPTLTVCLLECNSMYLN